MFRNYICSFSHQSTETFINVQDQENIINLKGYKSSLIFISLDRSTRECLMFYQNLIEISNTFL
jgi:hypothetical protein